MTRLSTLFAIAAMAVLLLGVLTSHLDLQSGLAVSLPTGSYYISYNVLCFGAALFFCLFAFVYSIWMVPWSAQAAMWHFGLSIFCVAAFLAASIAINRPGIQEHMTRSATLVFVLYCFAPILFLLVQSFYILDGLRRCLFLIHRVRP